MNVLQYTHLLNKPESVNNNQIKALEQILIDFPYLQSARCLHLKGLFKQDNFKYNQALKITAAHTQERNILFDFITSNNFIGVQKQLFDANELKLNNVEVIDIEIITPVNILPNETNTLELSILNSIQAATTTISENEVQIKNDSTIVFEKKNITSNIEIENLKTDEILDLEIGKPLQFDKNETHSFQEWLKLSKFSAIKREEIEQKMPEIENNLISKLEIIDKFIETNPKIPTIDKNAEPLAIAIKQEDTSYLMTETLAKVYLEQKKFNKAIQAYEILILKYPEKSSLFANRISEIKKLQ